MSKKVVIVGSTSLQNEIKKWISHWESKGFTIICCPKPIDEDNFFKTYPGAHKDFFESMTRADIVFAANEDKHGIKGYIGAETFAELAFVVTQNLVYGQNIEVILAKMPSEKVQSIDEIKLYLELDWIKIYNE